MTTLNVPDDWEIDNWGDVCEKIQDGTHFSPTTDQSEEFKYLTSKNVRFGHLDLARLEYINEKQHRAIYKRCDVRKDDVLLTKDGANTGNAAINSLSEEFSLLSSVAVLRPKRAKLSPDFLLQTILSEQGQRMIKDSMSGLAITRITLQIIKGFPIAFPSINEQTKIAEILSTVDLAIEQTEALITKQQRLKIGLKQDLLTRGIDEHGNLRSEQTHQFKDSPLGRIPVEWEVTRLESVSVFVTSGSRGWAQYYSTEGALFVRIGNLTRHHINMRFEDVVRVNPPKSSEGNRTAVMTGDLLISITADLGIIGVIPEGFEEAYVNQHISLVRLLDSEVDPRFVGWFLNSRSGQSQFEKLNESGAKAGLNLPTIKNLLIPKMEIEEQHRIAEILDASTQKGSELQQRLAKLLSLKTALMQDLLTGRKRVTKLLPG